MIVFKLSFIFFYLVHYNREKKCHKIGPLSFIVLRDHFLKRDPIRSKIVIERHLRIQPSIVGNLDTTGKVLIAQRFMLPDWKGIVIVIILSIKTTMWYTFKA